MQKKLKYYLINLKLKNNYFKTTSNILNIKILLPHTRFLKETWYEY